VIVRQARSQPEVDAALELRERVFVGEQGVSLEADRDGLDPEAVHVVAFEGERLVGTCRLVFADGLARLGRMAVEPDVRGRGLGAEILDAAERIARGRGAETMRLHAQVAARSLYERAGYEPRGAAFLEEGIEHQTMEKPLA
jgi:ElaA protein